MIQAQFLSYILQNHDMSLITLNNLTEDYFSEFTEEFRFCQEHYDTYGAPPDKETFLDKFRDFQLIPVNESPRYLVDALQEEYLYLKSLNVFNSVNKAMLDGDSRKGVEILLSRIPELTEKLNVEAVDLFREGAKTRFDEYCEKGNEPQKFYIKTGLPELDELIGGWNKRNDMVAICGRPGTGKSQLLLYFLYKAAESGCTVALYSGEMDESQVGYRLDTFAAHLSNYKLTRGFDDIFDDYKTHIDNLPNVKGKLLVCTPKTLGGVATVPKLKAFCERYHVDLLGVDQYSLLADVKHNKTRNERFEQISLDLKNMQIQLGIPVLVAAQMNRGGANEGVEDAGTEHLAGSDRISQDCSIIIKIIRRGDRRVALHLIKVRDSETGSKLTYTWDIDKGTLIHDDHHPEDDMPDFVAVIADDEQAAQNERGRTSNRNGNKRAARNAPAAGRRNRNDNNEQQYNSYVGSNQDF